MVKALFTVLGVFFFKKQKLMNNHQKPHLFHTPLYSFNDHLWPRSQPPELYYTTGYSGFPNDSAGKESACNAGDTGNSGLIPGSGRYPGKGNGNPHDGHDFLHIISGSLTTLG